MSNPCTEECTFQGEPALRLTAGALEATFVPGAGMTGVSLRYRGHEFLAVPGGIKALRAGHTGGLPLLAPWANRLSQLHYRVASTEVHLDPYGLKTDDNGLPIHGLLVGRPGWVIERCATRRTSAVLDASRDIDAPAFPFPHRIEVRITARDGELHVTTTVTPTGRRRVPVAFGWHPYLRVPGAPRSSWVLSLPTREHLLLDDRGIPNGATEHCTAEALPVGRRHFDDLYALGRTRRLSFGTGAPDTEGPGAPGGGCTEVELRCGPGYDFAQVWVPPRRQFAALEPMAAPTNALVEGSAPLVSPGDQYRAEFSLVLSAPRATAGP